MLRRLIYEIARPYNRLKNNGRWTQATFGNVTRVRYPDWGLDLRAGTSDFSSFVEVIDCKSYDLSRFPQWKSILAAYEKVANPLIIDAGANIGMASIWFARQFPRATILALEPEAENFGELRKHVAAFPNVRPMQAALTARDGFVAVTDPGLGSWGFRTEPAEDGIPAHSIATLAEEGDPFLLKIDIEGGEDGLFTDPAIIDRFTILFMEPHDWMMPGTSRSFVKAIGQLDRDLLISGENLVSIKTGT